MAVEFPHTSDNGNPAFSDYSSRNDDPEFVAEVNRAVSFAQILAASSFGTADAREERLAGRMKMQDLDYADDWASSDQANAQRRADEADVDARVANELEIRGYLFEAELRLRSILTSRSARLKLPLLLDVKGHHQEAI